MKIALLDASTIGTGSELEVFAQMGELTIFQSTSLEERLEHIADAEVVITNKVLIDRYVIEHCPNIRLVCITATGTNNVDLVLAEKHKIQVRNVKAYSTQSVAQHTMTCLLYQVSHLEYYKNYTDSGAYAQSNSFTHLGPKFHTLQGKTLGVIGLGAIGRKVAQLAEAFGCKICYYSTTGKNSTSEYQRLPLDQLLAESDYICIHAPLNDETYNMIAYKELCIMKPDAILLNMGRGGIINEYDLAKALINGKIASACLDVLESEPLQENSPLVPLLGTGRLLITPHIAWSSVEARKRLIEITVQNIKQYLAQLKG